MSPPFSLVPDQRDKKGYCLIHYLAKLSSYSLLKELCSDESSPDYLIYEKREDFLFSVYTFILRKNRNLKLDYETVLSLFEELDLRLTAISDEHSNLRKSGSETTESIFEKYFNLLSDYSLMLRQYPESTTIFDQNLIDRYVKILRIWILNCAKFSVAFSHWFKERDSQPSSTIELPNKKPFQPDLNKLKEFQEKFKDLQTLFNFVQHFFNGKQKETINLKKVIDSFNRLGFPKPEETLIETGKTTLNLIHRLDHLVEATQSKLAKKERKEIPFVELLQDEDREDSYQLLEYLRIHENLTIISRITNTLEGMPFQQAYLTIFGILEEDRFKLNFESFGIQEGRDLRTFGMTFEIKILAKEDDNRALTQPEIFLNALTQKVERLKQLPSYVKQKLSKDLAQKNFKSLEEELNGITSEKIDKSLFNHLRKHEIAMNISLFGAFINQDLTAVHDRIEEFLLDPQNEGLFCTLADLQKLYSLSMADMYQLEEALTRNELERKKDAE